MTINLGNIISSGGKTVASGIASGFDSSKLIDDLTKARRIPAVKLEDTIKTNDAKVKAYGEMRTVLEKLNSAVSFIRNAPGINNEADNIFQYRKSTVSSNTSVAGSNYVSASISPGAELSSYNLQVQQIARQRISQSTSFSSNNTSVVEAANGVTPGLFSAGTIELASTGAQPVDIGTKITGSLNASQVTVQGGLLGGLLSAGISNIQITGTGDYNLNGKLTSFDSTYNSGAGTLTLTTKINGVTYTSNAVAANSTIGADTGISSGTTVTFTNSSTGTSFDVVLGQDVVINATQSNIDDFEVNLASALSSQSIFQERQVTSFTDANVKSPLVGLTSANISLKANDYNTDGTAGKIEGFTVTADTGSNNGAISVTIDGEVFSVTGLGAGVGDTEANNLTLTAASGKTFKINLADAGVTLDLSSQASADSIATALNYAFGSQKLTNITIAQGDTLLDIAGKFNSLQTQTGVSATVIKVSATDYRLSLQANQPGLDNSFSFFDPTGVLSQVSFSDVSTAQDAIFSVNGVEVQRSANVIDDVIDGVSFSLLQPTPNYGLPSATEVSVGVQADTTTVENAVVNFINAYNDFRVFLAKQTATNDDGTLTEDAVLGTDSTLSQLTTQLESIITGVVSGTDNSALNSLGSLGITLTNFEGDKDNPATKNILTYDPTKLKNALASNFDDLRQVFEFSFSSNSSELALSSYTGKTTLADYKLDIDVGRAAGQQVAVRDLSNNLLFYADLTAIAGGGYTITGKTDTSLEGLRLVYTGDGTDNITVNSSQGIAAKLYDITSTATKKDGTVDTSITNIQSEDDRLKDEIDRIDQFVNQYRDRLVSQYSRLEEKVSFVNTLLQFLDTQAKSIFGSN